MSSSMSSSQKPTFTKRDSEAQMNWSSAATNDIAFLCNRRDRISGHKSLLCLSRPISCVRGQNLLITTKFRLLAACPGSPSYVHRLTICTAKLCTSTACTSLETSPHAYHKYSASTLTSLTCQKCLVENNRYLPTRSVFNHLPPSPHVHLSKPRAPRTSYHNLNGALKYSRSKQQPTSLMRRHLRLSRYHQSSC